MLTSILKPWTRSKSVRDLAFVDELDRSAGVLTLRLEPRGEDHPPADVLAGSLGAAVAAAVLLVLVAVSFAPEEPAASSATVQGLSGYSLTSQ